MRPGTARRLLDLIDTAQGVEPEEEASIAASGVLFAAMSMKRHGYNRKKFLRRCGEAWDSVGSDD